MSTLKEKHNQHIFTITTELDPPKSASSSVTEAQVVKVAPYVDAVNIADCPMAKMRMSPIALSSIIQSRYQVESIFHLTCRDRNVIGLQAELLGAYALESITFSPSQEIHLPSATTPMPRESLK